MKWEAIFEAYNQVWTEQGTEPDPFHHLLLCTQAQPAAGVAMTASRSTDYGKIKCTATVTLICPQQEETLNMAGEVAFQKALEFCNTGFNRLLENPSTPTS